MRCKLLSIYFLITLPLACILASSASAADDDKSTLLTLSVTESVEIEEDMLVAYMQYEHEAELARDVQNAINKRMKQALDMAGKAQEIKFSTERYNIYKYYPNRRKNDSDKDKYIWRGNQNIVIKSMNSDKLLKLAGDLQNIGLLMNGLNFVVSPEKYEETKDSLLEAAIQKLKTKAERATRALGKQRVEFVNINVDSNNRYPVPMARSYAMSEGVAAKDAMADPVAAPGQTRVNLTVSAVVRIE